MWLSPKFAVSVFVVCFFRLSARVTPLGTLLCTFPRHCCCQIRIFARTLWLQFDAPVFCGILHWISWFHGLLLFMHVVILGRKVNKCRDKTMKWFVNETISVIGFFGPGLPIGNEICGSGVAGDTRPPSWSNFFHFHAVSEKMLPNNRFSLQNQGLVPPSGKSFFHIIVSQ